MELVSLRWMADIASLRDVSLSTKVSEKWGNETTHRVHPSHTHTHTH